MNASTAVASKSVQGKAGSKNKGQVAPKAPEAKTDTAVASTTAPAADAAPAAPTTPAAPAAPKLNAGDAAILACKTAGATCQQLLKAVWSTRGNIYATIEGFDFGGVAIIKSDLVGMLKAMPAADAAPFTLTPRSGKEGGADLAVIKKAAEAKK
jgi:hypothetical protein